MKQVRCLYAVSFAQNMVKLVQEGNGGTAKNVILSL